MRLSYEQLTRIWRASASDNHLTRDDLSLVKIDNATAALLESADSFSFRAEGHLVYGISQIWQNKAEFLLKDSELTDSNIGTAFREYLEAVANSQPDEARASAIGDLDLADVLSIPQSLLSSSLPSSSGAKPPAIDGDLSIDAIVRGGEEDMRDELSEGENVTRTAEERAALETLDFGLDEDDEPMDMGGGGDPGILDFGSDLPYSSSPPHTPNNELEADVHINGGSSPQHVRELPAKRRRRGAPVDDIISIVRPKRASTKILRQPPQIPEFHSFHHHQIDDNSYIRLDDATEKLLDPEYVQEEMKRRRRLAAGEMEVDEMDDTVEFGNLDLGDDDLDLDGIRDGYESSEEEEYDDTQETIENEQKKARDNIRHALRKKGDTVHFEDLASTAVSKASTLMEVLALATRGKLHATQEQMWGTITVAKA